MDTTMNRHRQPFQLEEIEIPEVELISPQEEPLVYIIAVKTGLESNKFADYNPAQIEQLDEGSNEAYSVAYRKYKSMGDQEMQSFILTQRIHVALQLFLLKEKKNYAEYISIKNEEPITRKER